MITNPPDISKIPKPAKAYMVWLSLSGAWYGLATERSSSCITAAITASHKLMEDGYDVAVVRNEFTGVIEWKSWEDEEEEA